MLQSTSKINPANIASATQSPTDGRKRLEERSFADMLASVQSDQSALRFSAHAQTRLKSREIQLAPAQMNRIGDAVNRAASKGAKESLVLVDDLAMVVSISNRTVITVMDKENLKQNVFTNIDSAVIA